MRPPIYTLLAKLDEFNTQKEKIDYLKSIDHPAIRTVLLHMFLPEMKFVLPPGNPPYEKTKFEESGMLWSEARRLYLFTATGNPNLTSVRREKLFIDLLESLVEEDATLVLSIKDQKSPVKSLNKKLVEKAYPGIFGDRDG
jgi:hypothetical protein